MSDPGSGDTRIVAITVNCPDLNTAEKIARTLIDARLVAAANIQSAIQSTYIWKGRINERPEVPIVLKTRAALFERAAEAIRGVHPYEAPSVTGLFVDRVTDDYRRWVAEMTRD